MRTSREIFVVAWFVILLLTQNLPAQNPAADTLGNLKRLEKLAPEAKSATVLFIDTSGSMRADNKWGYSVSAILGVLEEIPDGTLLIFGRFDVTSEILLVSKVDDTVRSQVKDILGTLKPSGRWTHYDEVIKTSMLIQEHLKSGETQVRFLVLTDGLPDPDKEKMATSIEDFSSKVLPAGTGSLTKIFVLKISSTIGDPATMKVQSHGSEERTFIELKPADVKEVVGKALVPETPEVNQSANTQTNQVSKPVYEEKKVAGKIGPVLNSLKLIMAKLPWKWLVAVFSGLMFTVAGIVLYKKWLSKTEKEIGPPPVSSFANTGKDAEQVSYEFCVESFEAKDKNNPKEMVDKRSVTFLPGGTTRIGSGRDCDIIMPQLPEVAMVIRHGTGLEFKVLKKDEGIILEESYKGNTATNNLSADFGQMKLNMHASRIKKYEPKPIENIFKAPAKNKETIAEQEVMT